MLRNVRDDGLLAMQLDQALHGDGEHQGHRASCFKSVLRARDKHTARGQVERASAAPLAVNIDIDICRYPLAGRTASLAVHHRSPPRTCAYEVPRTGSIDPGLVLQHHLFEFVGVGRQAAMILSTRMRLRPARFAS